MGFTGLRCNPGDPKASRHRLPIPPPQSNSEGNLCGILRTLQIESLQKILLRNNCTNHISSDAFNFQQEATFWCFQNGRKTNGFYETVDIRHVSVDVVLPSPSKGYLSEVHETYIYFQGQSTKTP